MARLLTSKSFTVKIFMVVAESLRLVRWLSPVPQPDLYGCLWGISQALH